MNLIKKRTHKEKNLRRNELKNKMLRGGNRMFDFVTEVDRSILSGSLKMAMTAKGLKEQGIQSFIAGELDVKTAPSLLRSVKELTENGLFGFTLPDDKYLECVASWTNRVRGWKIDPTWVVPAYGTIYSLATAIKAFVPEKGNIIVQPPFYDRYEQAAKRLGRGIVLNPLKRTEDSYEMDLEGLETLMRDPKNGILVLCNPLNPSGKVFNKEELEKVAHLSAITNTIVFADEIFSEVLLEGDRVVPYASIEEGKAFAITTMSLGKSFNMTGLNHANILIPDEDLRKRFKEQRTSDHFGSIDPVGYAATMGAYSDEGYAWLQALNDHIRNNSRIVHEAFENYFPDYQVLRNEGSFVCWIDFRKTGLKGDALSQMLMEKAKFHINEGTEYGPGCEGYVRMNLGSTKHQTEWAMERLIQGLPR